MGEIAVPPKYAASDFRKQGWWRLRGKLDVPKARFILYPLGLTLSDLREWRPGPEPGRRRR